MPQLKFEYSDNIRSDVNFQHVLSHVHQILTQTISCNIEDCKSRIVKLDNYFISQGEKENAMVHLEVNILEGRSDELKHDLGQKLLSLLNSVFTNIEGMNLQITVEIKDIIKNNYHKSTVR